MNKKRASIDELIKKPSILARVIKSQSELDNIASSSALRLEISQRLAALETEDSQTRAAFILKQDEDNFKTNREAWGIPNFDEDLITLEDFKDGFLWRFRAHTTSWNHNQYADEWFYTSLEARSITRYEFWDCDEGPEKADIVMISDYKSILKKLLVDYVYEVLISPAFSNQELSEYIHNFCENEEDYSLEDVIDDYISRNPNFKP